MEPEGGSWAWLLIDVVFVAIGCGHPLWGHDDARRRRDRLTKVRRDEATRELYDKGPPAKTPPE